jgi:hypothetical protein
MGEPTRDRGMTGRRQRHRHRANRLERTP